jgi:hypothetical protein
LLLAPRLKPWAILDRRSAALNGFKNVFKKLCVLCVLCGYPFSVKPLTSYTGKLTDEQPP